MAELGGGGGVTGSSDRQIEFSFYWDRYTNSTYAATDLALHCTIDCLC